MKLSEIHINPKNPRLIKDDRFKKLCKSIQEFPKMMSIRPIIVDSEGMILGGNMRFKALKELGYKTIPDEWVKRDGELTEAEKQRFIIADNVPFGEYDWDILANEWDKDELIDWGLEVLDYFEGESTNVVNDNYVIPDEIKTDIVIGDLFELNNHKLLCGDSTNTDDVSKLMQGVSSELLFTSPPYSDMRTYNGGKDLTVDHLVEFIPTWMPFVKYQVINLGLQRKDNEVVQYWDDYIQKAKDCGYKFLSWNVWNKTEMSTIASATSMFGITHEWIFVFGEARKNLNRTVPNKEKPKTVREKHTVRKADGSHEATTTLRYNNHQLHSVVSCLYEIGNIRSSHPATFPIELPSEYIKAMTNKKDIICDPFIGSGTTMVACHQLNRKCYGMEIDTKYCQVIIDRMRKLDPGLTIKKNGKLL